MHLRSLSLASVLLVSSSVACSAADDAAPPASPDTPPAATDAEHVLLARLVLIASDVDRAADRAEAQARAREGVADQIEVGEARAHLTLRVPATSLSDLEHDLATLGTIRDRERSSEDVTVALAEARTRIDVRRAEQARLTAMMESRTSTLAEVLEVERELTRVTEALDVLEADERAIATRVAHARVELTIVAAPSEEGIGALPTTALAGLALAGRMLLGLVRLLLFLGPSVLALALLARVSWALAPRARGLFGVARAAARSDLGPRDS